MAGPPATTAAARVRVVYFPGGVVEGSPLHPRPRPRVKTQSPSRAGRRWRLVRRVLVGGAVWGVWFFGNGAMWMVGVRRLRGQVCVFFCGGCSFLQVFSVDIGTGPGAPLPPPLGLCSFLIRRPPNGYPSAHGGSGEVAVQLWCVPAAWRGLCNLSVMGIWLASALVLG